MSEDEKCEHGVWKYASCRQCQEQAIRADEREKTIQAIQDGTIAVGLMRRLTAQARADERRVMAKECETAMVCERCKKFCFEFGEEPPCDVCPIRKAVEG